jgi:hypothetical protein
VPPRPPDRGGRRRGRGEGRETQSHQAHEERRDPRRDPLLTRVSGPTWLPSRASSRWGALPDGRARRQPSTKAGSRTSTRTGAARSIRRRGAVVPFLGQRWQTEDSGSSVRRGRRGVRALTWGSASRRPCISALRYAPACPGLPSQLPPPSGPQPRPLQGEGPEGRDVRPTGITLALCHLRSCAACIHGALNPARNLAPSAAARVALSAPGPAWGATVSSGQPWRARLGKMAGALQGCCSRRTACGSCPKGCRTLDQRAKGGQGWSRSRDSAQLCG